MFLSHPNGIPLYGHIYRHIGDAVMAAKTSANTQMTTDPIALIFIDFLVLRICLRYVGTVHWLHFDDIWVAFVLVRYFFRNRFMH